MKKRTLYLLGIIIYSFAVVLSITPDAWGADVDSNDALLSMLPQDCMFCIRINNLNESLGKMDAYLAGASPIPMSLAMLLNMQLGAIVGDPMLTGIDQGGDFAVFGILSPADEPVWGILIPVNNFSEFVKTNPNCKQGEDGITMLSAPNSPVGGFALAEIANGKYALAVWEMTKDQLPLLSDAIKKSITPLGKKISPAQAKEAVSAPAWAYVNLAGFNEKYGKDALAALEMSQQQMKQSGQAAGMGDMMDFQIKLLKEMFNTFAGDADSATIALNPEATILNLDIAFKAKDGSELSKMLVSGTNPPKFTYYNYLDNDLAVNGLMKMDGSTLLPFYNKMFDIMEAASDDPTSKEQTAKMKALTKKAFDAMGDDVSFSYSYASGMPPFFLQEVIEIKDVEAMKAMMGEGMDYANTMYKAMGFPIELEYKPAVSTHNETTIDAVLFSVPESDDPNNMMQQEMAKMYGDGFKYYIAFSSDKMYVTMGADGERKIKALIDKPSTASAPSGDIKVAVDALQATPFNDFICSVNIIKLMKGMGDMMQTMSAQPGMEDMNPAMEMFKSLNNVQTQSCLVTGGKTADGTAAIRVALPKQHLIEIIAAAMQIQQQAMATTQSAQNPTESMAPTAIGTPAPQPSSALQEAPKDPLTDWIGKPAPELKMVDLEGKIYRISRLKGKKVILDFWATWCPPCKKTIPDLIKLAGSSDSDLVILGLSDETTDTLAPFVKEAKMNYPVIAYGEKLEAPYGQVTALPTLLLIDSEGVIQDVLVGYHEPEVLQSRLNKIK